MRRLPVQPHSEHTMKRALVDQDVQPGRMLREAVGDRLDLELGVDSTEEALDGKHVLFSTS